MADEGVVCGVHHAFGYLQDNAGTPPNFPTPLEGTTMLLLLHVLLQLATTITIQSLLSWVVLPSMSW
jgi:hypothetical protein